MSTQRDAIVTTPIVEIKAVVDLLHELDLDPLHLHVDGRRPTDQRPTISMWMRYRTDFQQVCEALRVKPKERSFPQPGQRAWFAESDTLTRRLLIECVSFEHHDDWQPRTPTTGADDA